MKKIKAFLITALALAFWFVLAQPALAGGLADNPSDDALYVLGSATAGETLVNGTAEYSSAVNVQGLGGPLGIWVQASGTTPVVKIAYQVSTARSNSVAAFGYPEGSSWVVETLNDTNVHQIVKNVDNLGWLRFAVFPISGTSPKVTLKVYRPTVDSGPGQLTYPLSTTACADGAIASRGGKLIAGAVLTRVVDSGTDTTVKVVDGTDATGTQYIYLGLQATEGSVSVMFPRPIEFATGIFADFDVDTGEACIQLYEVK